MATPGVYTNPSIEAASLDIDEKQAFEEGHDADLPIGNTAKTAESTLEKDFEIEPTSEKAVDESDPNEVWWDGPDDPANPLNWTSKRKWGNIAILSLVTLITPLASSMFAPGVPAVLKEFGSSSETLATFVVSVYLIGLAFGPLIIAPLSEIYGRYWIYVVSNVLFIIFAIACAEAQTFGQLIAFRFLHGIAGVAPLTIGGGTISDIMPVEKRGGAMAIWAMGPLLGPVAGPVAGGYLVEATSWRWVFYLLAILSGVSAILTFFFTEETYHPTLLQKKAKQLRKESGNQQLRSKLASPLTKKQVFIQSIIRPTKMLLFSPIITAVCVYTAVTYGILYLLFTTFTFVFSEQYGFGTGTTGLTFIPLGVGMILSLGIMGVVTDRRIKAKQLAKIEVKPEDRIPIDIVLTGALSLPIGLFIYGWTVQFKVHWIVPLIGTAFVGFGLLIIFMAMQTYLVDAFTVYAASAVAANTVLRSLLGGLLPLAGLGLYNKIGFGWGDSLLGFIALALVPIPVLFSIYGERLRNRFQIKL